jgi:peptide/bleomycin uptake transporter
MFVSFFPRPKMFFISAALWTLFVMFFWFLYARNFGQYIGLPNPAEGTAPINGLSIFWSPPFIYFYLYYAAIVAVFSFVWYLIDPMKWFAWSVLGSALIIFMTYYLVQVSVAINTWYGPFYDLIQAALGKTRPVTAGEFYDGILIFLNIALVAIVFRSLLRFFVQHYIFRWRTAMNDFYMSNWQSLRTVEGAAQRVQEDAQKFAENMEDLGTTVIDSVMTFIAFFPLLMGYSKFISTIPFIGSIPYPLVIATFAWTFFGTALTYLVGIKLPGLEFKNQRVEAAFRKELVYGEDHEARASNTIATALFADIRRNYFVKFAHTIYFNVGRLLYLQTDNIFPYILLVPTFVVGAITLGQLNQITNAMDKVRESIQFFIQNWPDIIKQISIYKRLRAFEATIVGDPLSSIERDPNVV